MGTIKTGFWKINFIFTPGEFKELLNSCVQKGIAFHLRTYGYPEHTVVQVIDTYKNAYQFLSSSEKPPQTSLALPYSMSFPKPFIGFNLKHEVKEGWLFKAYQLQMKSYH